MKTIYLHSEQASKTYRYPVNVRPAGDVDFIDVLSAPRSFFKAGGDEPRTFVVEFEYGAATIDDDLGKYLIDRGIAHAKRMPSTGRVRQFFDKAGRVFGELFDEHGNRVADYNSRGAR